MDLVVKDSKWLGSEGRVFLVTEIRKQDDEEWVHYTRMDVDDERVYCCLKEAFLSRFGPDWS